MPVAAWLSSLWEFLRDLDTDEDPIERLEARVVTLERWVAAARTTPPSDILQSPDQASETSSP